MLVILDRDGVINEDSDDFIKTLDEWIPIPGSIDAIARLSQNGFTVTIATNQSGIGRGIIDLDNLEAIHERLNELVEDAGGKIAGIFYCPHHPDDDCECRKPKPGLITAIEAELGESALGSWMIGDSLRDLEAGESKGCVPVLVRTGKGERTLAKLQNDYAEKNSPEWQGLRVYANLAEAADALIADTNL
jgi:D-glycero-D-manno-heptose 1,7-bisphosphate phosphatase